MCESRKFPRFRGLVIHESAGNFPELVDFLSIGAWTGDPRKNLKGPIINM